MARTNRFPIPREKRDYRPFRPPSRRPYALNDNKHGFPGLPANDNYPMPSPADMFPNKVRIPGYRKWQRIVTRAMPYGWLYGVVGFLPWLTPTVMPDPSRYGFILLCKIGPPPIRKGMSYGQYDAPNACGVPAYANNSMETFPGIPASNGRSYTIAYTSEPPVAEGGTLGIQLEEWWRPARWQGGPAPGEYPASPPARPPTTYLPPNLPDYLPHPWLDPFKPPLLPEYPPLPRPPYRRPDKPYLPEDREVGDIDPLPKPPPQPLPRTPRKRERERKIRIKDLPNMRLRRILGWLLSAASESGDFLESLYDALPDTLQSEDDTMADKFDKVFKNLDKVDFTKAVDNLWTNQVEDRYFGKGFSDMTDALESFGVELPSLKL